jgi:hypothetical protein
VGFCQYTHNSCSRIFFNITKRLGTRIFIQVTSEKLGDAGRGKSLVYVVLWKEERGIIKSYMSSSLMCSFVQKTQVEA